MFAWFTSLFGNDPNFWIGYVCGMIPGAMLGIGYMCRRVEQKEAKQLAADREVRRQVQAFERHKQLTPFDDAVANRILEKAELLDLMKDL